MTPRIARLLVALYPKPWRDRYGAEYEQVLLDLRHGPRDCADTLRAALREHLFPCVTPPGVAASSVLALARFPSAALPMLMSLAALLLLCGFLYLAHRGIVPLQSADGDEGAAARTYQLLMAGQAPLIAWFAFRWLPRRPVQSMVILLLQLALACASLVPLLVLES